MNQDWQNFLAQQGAQLNEGIIQHFGDIQAELIATRDDEALCDLSQFGTLKVEGEEAQKFLQNLLSNDINNINAKTAQLSSLNSPKGRMMATFLIWQQGTDYFLQLPRDLVAAMHKRLAMYVMRSKVKITDVSDEIICIGLSGKAAAEHIKKILGATPGQDWAVSQHDNTCIVRFNENRFQINTSVKDASSLWSKLAVSAKPVSSSCWDWLNIHAGIPVVTPATQEQFVLQMANLDILGGVSFKKGCYPGQEIVARTHYLGKQKRRMFLAHINSTGAVTAGDQLVSAEMAEQACGMVMNACQAPGGGFDILAVMQINSRENQTVHLQSMQGAKLEFLPLPYSLPADE